ncbi:MAG: hypothetical protein JST36_05380 [Bacteroidetes bacterium]|nr:hypothetical protein [Bacteroidota bacterium]
MNILVFKTDIDSDYDLEGVDELLSGYETVVQWNVDREDVDRVLRVESTVNNGSLLQQRMSEAGYLCVEMAD